MLKVFTLVLYLQVQAASTFLVPPSLGIGESLFGFPVPTGVAHRFASREGGKRCETNINTNFLLSGREFLCGDAIAGEHGIPLYPFSLERDGFDCALDVAVQLDPHQTDILDAQLVVEFDAVAIGRKCYRIEPVSTLETREPGLLLGFDTSEESIVSFLQATKSALTRGTVQQPNFREGIPEFFELGALVVIVQREFAASPRIATLLKSEIIQSPSRIQQRVEFFNLNAVGVQPEFEGSSHFSLARNSSTARRTISATLRSSFFESFLNAASCGSVI